MHFLNFFKENFRKYGENFKLNFYNYNCFKNRYQTHFWVCAKNSSRVTKMAVKIGRAVIFVWSTLSAEVEVKLVFDRNFGGCQYQFKKTTSVYLL